MVNSRGGQFVIEGRGFGHGVGLPQVSAWALARDGVSGENIVARYYPGATLARMWR
jgi:stage II sporulation protein D